MIRPVLQESFGRNIKKEQKRGARALIYGLSIHPRISPPHFSCFFGSGVWLTNLTINYQYIGT
jgi:hypothetical protein